MNLVKQIVNVSSQSELYRLVKNVDVLDHGDKVSVPYFIADQFDSDYKQGVNRANGLASDGKYHDFGAGKWQLSGDNAPCYLSDAIGMAVRTVLYAKLGDIQRKMQKYYTAMDVNPGQQRISYNYSSKRIHQAADKALGYVVKLVLSAHDDQFDEILDGDLGDYGIESRKTIMNDSDELKQFSSTEQDYIKNSGYHYFIVEVDVSPDNFIAPDDVSAVAGNLAEDILMSHNLLDEVFADNA